MAFIETTPLTRNLRGFSNFPTIPRLIQSFPGDSCQFLLYESFVSWIHHRNSKQTTYTEIELFDKVVKLVLIFSTFGYSLIKLTRSVMKASLPCSQSATTSLAASFLLFTSRPGVCDRIPMLAPAWRKNWLGLPHYTTILNRWRDKKERKTHCYVAKTWGRLGIHSRSSFTIVTILYSRQQTRFTTLVVAQIGITPDIDTLGEWQIKYCQYQSLPRSIIHFVSHS